MYITPSYLKKYKGTRDKIMGRRRKSLPNLLFKLFGDDIPKIDEFPEYQSSIFISHKHGEVEILELSRALLESLGVKVYIDWQDEKLPEETSGDTARQIKRKINECQKFILLATVNAIESKWCNWELGIADAKKFPDNIAVMPIANDNGEWNGYEYLDIYPIISMNDKNEYVVEYGRSAVSLHSWLIK